MIDRDASEVKGVWFVTARRYLVSAYDTATMDALVAHVDEPHRAVLREPFASAWYPEEALRQSLDAMMTVAARRDEAVFCEAIEQSTLLGIRHFFRILMRLGTPSFVLRQLPTVTRQVRRSSLHVEVETGDRRAIVRYSRFPWFRDRTYRLVARAQLRTIMRVSVAAWCTSDGPPGAGALSRAPRIGPARSSWPMQGVARSARGSLCSPVPRFPRSAARRRRASRWRAGSPSAKATACARERRGRCWSWLRRGGGSLPDGPYRLRRALLRRRCRMEPS